jgi:hypothetical protein
MDRPITGLFTGCIFPKIVFKNPNVLQFFFGPKRAIPVVGAVNVSLLDNSAQLWRSAIYVRYKPVINGGRKITAQDKVKLLRKDSKPTHQR